MRKIPPAAFVLGCLLVFGLPFLSASAAYRFADFKAHPPIHIYGSVSPSPKGMSPAEIKKIYHLPAKGGHGTIALIGAYDDPTIEHDLNVFSAAFGLSACTSKNKCFEKHKMTAATKADTGWSEEMSLDVEWSHAIAPNAKILLVEAKTPSGANLMKAVDYARKRADVVAVSMSWGGAEFSDEAKYDSHFTGSHAIAFFASSGDDGAGASWPAASPYVVAVGGTSLSLSASGALVSEKAWNGSGGGVSAYEKEPAYQARYVIPKAGGFRAIPDVAYDADPQSGFSVYLSPKRNSKNGWYVFGGTSAGAPQWAAIRSLGLSAANPVFYADKASDLHTQFFRDIASGSNGSCAYFCTARKHYDYVTGLGSPLTVNF
ncbi:MAG TPA: S53 family peptidase [Candidatus Paceibacterota bacterium]|nr:S53 family peptidase [Candidatus Paceibacterota bacterium]